MNLKKFVTDTDRLIVQWMNKHGVLLLRISLALIFIWYGALKWFGMSEAEALVKKAVGFSPILHSRTFFHVLGTWEVIIGVCFLFNSTLRIGIFLMAVQMSGTFLPLVTATDACFVKVPFQLTLEGQYVIKNLILISGAIVVGGSLHKKYMAAKAEQNAPPMHQNVT